jgi:hypothetical protein
LTYVWKSPALHRVAQVRWPIWSCGSVRYTPYRQYANEYLQETLPVLSSKRDPAVNEISNFVEPDGSNGAAQPPCTLPPTLSGQKTAVRTSIPSFRLFPKSLLTRTRELSCVSLPWRLTPSKIFKPLASPPASTESASLQPTPPYNTNSNLHYVSQPCFSYYTGRRSCAGPTSGNLSNGDPSRLYMGEMYCCRELYITVWIACHRLQLEMGSHHRVWQLH